MICRFEFILQPVWPGLAEPLDKAGPTTGEEIPTAIRCFFKSRPKKKIIPTLPAITTQQEVAQNEQLEQWLICAQCGGGITKPESQISIDGGHKHTFANPHGIVFEIGCFAQALGCLAIGEATADFSWFRGYKWRIAICARCSIHLGWRFESGAGDSFFGLILDRLRSISGHAGNQK